MISNIRKILTKNNAYYILVFLLAAIVGFDYNILHGFFPFVAPTKNVSIVLNGLLYSEYEIINLIVFPFAGKLAVFTGGNVALFLGAFLCGISSIFFGISYIFTSGIPFIASSFAFRGTGAIGAAICYVVNAAVIVSIGQSDKICTLISTLEAVMTGGILLGPTVGSILYEYGGYMCPFALSGTLMIVMSLIVLFTFPSFKSSTTKDRRLSVFLTNVTFWVNILALFVISFNEGFQSTCFILYCKEQFKMTPITSSLAFLSDPLAFVIVSPAIGMLNDAFPSFPPISICVGLLVEAISLCFMGPLPFLGINPHIAISIVASVVNGLGYAFVFSPVYVQLLKLAYKAGLSEDFQTNSTVSSFHLFFSILGLAFGPTIGVLFYDYFGYGYACGLFALLMVFEIVVIVVMIILPKMSGTDLNDYCRNHCGKPIVFREPDISVELNSNVNFIEDDC